MKIKWVSHFFLPLLWVTFLEKVDDDCKHSRERFMYSSRKRPDNFKSFCFSSRCLHLPSTLKRYFITIARKSFSSCSWKTGETISWNIWIYSDCSWISFRVSNILRCIDAITKNLLHSAWSFVASTWARKLLTKTSPKTKMNVAREQI